MGTEKSMPALPKADFYGSWATVEDTPLYTAEQLHAYAQQYAEQRVQEEREACAALCEEIQSRKGERFFGQLVSNGSAGQAAAAIRQRSKQ